MAGLVMPVRCQVAVCPLNAGEDGHKHKIDLRSPRSGAHDDASE